MHKVIIVGAGFAGLQVAKRLTSSLFDITIIDKHNYHLFQPLLYQIATAGLSPAEIAQQPTHRKNVIDSGCTGHRASILRFLFSMIGTRSYSIR